MTIQEGDAINDGPYDIADPKAEALVESLRAFGYTTQAAIADLVDNSISAGAGRISLEMHWKGRGSWVRITDDGHGMNEVELIEAMRAGSQSPKDARDADDLGRFGLGLKTASFSQAREMTVATRRDGETAVRRWDLDVVADSNEWRLLKSISTAQEALLDLDELASGTVVLWQRLDRVVGDVDADDERARNRFQHLAEQVEEHLAATFFRYVTGPSRVRIEFNGTSIEGWDPFLPKHPKTQALQPETTWIGDQHIEIAPFVLPHHKSLSDEEFQRAAGIGGWNAQQGFYLYRNRRLIVAGGWLNLGFKNDEHAKLARIRIDIPNSMDELWQIDVRKARAQPPGPVRDALRRIGRKTREQAVGVYRNRGGKAVGKPGARTSDFVWGRKKDADGMIAYRINRKHPMVELLLSDEDTPRSRRAAALRLVEETVPIAQIAIDHSENADSQFGPLEGTDSDEIIRLALEVRDALRERGETEERIAILFETMEPFSRYVDLVLGALDAYEQDA